MGCDIHMMAEIRRKEKEGKYAKDDADYQKWEVVDEPVFTNIWYRPEDKNDYEWNTPRTKAPYDGRNYKLFSFLADVRNGRGFAGTDTGDRIEPIADERGVPGNASMEWKADCWDGEGFYHSHSYFTLEELENADWEQIVTSRYYMSPEAYIAYRDNGTEPEMTWGGGSGLHVTAAEFEKMADEDREQVRGVQVEDHKPIKELVGSFYTQTMPELADLAKEEGVKHDEIRIVFAFDN
jgi:hypothetical protein